MVILDCYRWSTYRGCVSVYPMGAHGSANLIGTETPGGVVTMWW